MTADHFLYFLEAYFETSYVVAGIAAGISTFVALFIVFISIKTRRLKSASLLSMMLTSGAIWVFSLSSFAFCFALQDQYYYYTAGRVISVVARLALATSLLALPAAFLILRKRFVREIYPYFSANSLQKEQDFSNRRDSIFSRLVSKSHLSNVAVSSVSAKASLPVSAALDWRGKKSVAISEEAEQILEDDELEAVLAHELGHLQQRDSFKRTLATIYRVSFPFDPLARFIEAAVYREGEFSADEYSATLTRKPASLASALLKLYEFVSHQGVGVRSASGAIMPSIFWGKDSGLLSKQPKLTTRINRLLELESELPE